MKWNFPTNQEKKIGLLVSLVSIFSISSILKKNFGGPLAWATSFYIRETFRGPPKTGSRATSGPRANTLAYPVLVLERKRRGYVSVDSI